METFPRSSVDSQEETSLPCNCSSNEIRGTYVYIDRYGSFLLDGTSVYVADPIMNGVLTRQEII